MAFFGNALDWVLAFFLFGLLLFIHESGHFIMARLTGVKVEEFGFGFPPRLIKLFSWKGTDFTLNVIPFGAFVRPLGEDDPLVEGGLAAASKRVRALVLIGGVLANLLAALLAFTLAFKIAFPDGVFVNEVAAESPAAQSGLRVGDKILAADGQSIQTTQQLVQYVYDHLGIEITLRIQRESQETDIHVTPRTAWPEGQGPSGLVLRMNFSDQRSWGEAIQQAFLYAGEQLKLILQLPAMILRGGTSSANFRPVGPVGILDVTEQIVGLARETNRWVVILDWIGMINLALAIGNILPIPALDGGRLLFVGIEAIRGRRVNPERERMIHAATLMLLLCLMVFITYLDFFFPILPR